MTREGSRQASPPGAAGFSEPLECRRLLAGVALAVDLDTRTESGFPDTGHQIVVAGDVAFGDVAVARNSSEEELAFSDGTPGGTRIAKEIVPGLAGTRIGEVHPFGNMAIFMTHSPDRSTGSVWRSDGTESGTFPLLSWATGSGMSSDLWYGAELGGKFYFPISDRATNQSGLGVTDGTVEGTGVVKWLGSTPDDITAFNGNLYFSARDVAGFNQGTGYELWKSDGTADGTVLLKDINAGTSNSNPSSFTPVGSTLYFTASQGSFGLWKTDGTQTGTQLVTSSSSLRALTNFNGTLMYSSGNAIYRRMSETGTATLVKNVGFTVWGLETAGSRAYFVQNGNTYWQTDGTSAGTVPLSSPAGPMSSVSADMTPLGAKMLFRGRSTAHGDELWITDGTVAGTKLVADLRPGAASASPWMMASNAAGTRAFFAADDGNTGMEIWVSDGTAAGTRPTADLNLAGFSAQPRGLTKVGDAVYLSTRTAPTPGLYKTDGTQAGTTFLGAYDIAGRPESSRAPRTAAVGNRFFFSGRAIGAAHVGYELHVSDGTPAGTRLVKDIAPGTADSLPENLTAVGDTVFFFTISGGSRTLWRSDGTDANTAPVATGVDAAVAAVGDALYFSKGGELWKVPAAPGTAAQLVASTLPVIRGMGAVGAQLLLWCGDGLKAHFLYRSDGTPGGTGLVTQLPEAYAAVRDITDLGDGSAVFGYEGVWRTDLTAGGTLKISSVELNPHNAAGATVLHRGELYFRGRGPTSFYPALWKTDGTAAGTRHLMSASNDFTNEITELTVADGRVFFLAFSGPGDTLGHGLWESNGTPEGTRRVPGQPAGQTFPYPTSFLTELNRSLLYVADDRGLAGEEVFKIVPDAPAPLPAWVTPGSAATWQPGTNTLTVTGAATIVADPGPVAPLVFANGPAAVLTINPSSGRAVHVGGLTLTGGATATLASVTSSASAAAVPIDSSTDKALRGGGGKGNAKPKPKQTSVVTAAAAAVRTAQNSRVLVVNGDTLTIDANSRLDLADNNLILNYSGTSPAAGVEGMVKAGYNGGDWLGKRITSSSANADRNFALGVSDNSRLVIPFSSTRLFAGEAVDTTSVLVKFTHRVDLDLDGVITTNDATIFNSNYSEGAAARWGVGDLDFDGLFTTNDATLFNSYYDESLGAV